RLNVLFLVLPRVGHAGNPVTRFASAITSPAIPTSTPSRVVAQLRSKLGRPPVSVASALTTRVACSGSANVIKVVKRVTAPRARGIRLDDTREVRNRARRRQVMAVDRTRRGRCRSVGDRYSSTIRPRNP